MSVAGAATALRIKCENVLKFQDTTEIAAGLDLYNCVDEL